MTMAEAEQEASRARSALSRLEREAAAARENGTKMPAVFWEMFGLAVTSVRLAEHKVNKTREGM